MDSLSAQYLDLSQKRGLLSARLFLLDIELDSTTRSPLNRAKRLDLVKQKSDTWAEYCKLVDRIDTIQSKLARQVREKEGQK